MFVFIYFPAFYLYFRGFICFWQIYLSMFNKRFLCLMCIVLLLTRCAVYNENDDKLEERYDSYERCINDKNSTDDNSENCCILLNDRLDKSYCSFCLKKKKYKLLTNKLHRSKHKNHFGGWYNRRYGWGWHRRTGKFSFINRCSWSSRYNQKYSWTWRRKIGNIHHHHYLHQKRYKQHRKKNHRLSHRTTHRRRH